MALRNLKMRSLVIFELTVRSWIVPSIRRPVSGSQPIWPEQNMILPKRIAWDRKAGGAGALVVWTALGLDISGRPRLYLKDRSTIISAGVWKQLLKCIYGVAKSVHLGDLYSKRWFISIIWQHMSKSFISKVFHGHRACRSLLRTLPPLRILYLGKSTFNARQAIELCWGV